MVSPETVTVRAEQIEGLRELIRQVIVEERERLLPREFMIDMEALRRSPAGTVIRLEERVDHLSAKVEELSEKVDALRAEMDRRFAEMAVAQEALRAEMREGQEALRAEMKEGQEALRAEMKEGQEALRAEFRREISNLEKLMEARFAAMEARFDALEQRISRTDFWVKFFAGLVSALFVAQLVLTFVR